MSASLSRRQVLKSAAAAGVGAAVAGVWMAETAPASSAARAAALTHPGMLHTAADFSRMARQVSVGAQPWTAGWNRLTANQHSSSGWKPNPQRTIVRGGTGGQNYAILYNDIAAAYQNALRWRVSGDPAHAATAVTILNAWSSTLTTITGSADRFLAAGLYGYQFANAAEILRGYPGFDLSRCQHMMRTVFYPMNNDFLANHNGACVTNYWANWDLCTMCSVLAIGILCDDTSMVNQALTYFQSGAGNGSIDHAIPHVYSDGTAQWQESGRDQGHTMLGIGLMGTFCQMAYHQGTDLFAHENNKFLKACEYVARYNLGNPVSFTTYTWGSGVNCARESQTTISATARGDNRPIWELLYNHYVKVKGLSAPHTARYAARVRPEGGGGDYGSTSGGYDQLGFGTLTCTL